MGTQFAPRCNRFGRILRASAVQSVWVRAGGGQG
jgi:hypothetical protein